MQESWLAGQGSLPEAVPRLGELLMTGASDLLPPPRQPSGFCLVIVSSRGQEGPKNP